MDTMTDTTAANPTPTVTTPEAAAPITPSADGAGASDPAKAGEVATDPANHAAPDDGTSDPAKDDAATDPAPELPESYAIERGDVLASIADGDDDPVLAAVADVAKDLGLNKAEFEAVSKVMNGLAEKLKEAGLAQPQGERYSLEKELAGIERGKARFDAAVADIEARAAREELSAGEAGALAALVGTADGIAVFEKLLGASTRRETPIPTEKGEEAKVDDELDAIIKDPRWRTDWAWTRAQEKKLAGK
jgi:hypothetical protein